MKQDDFDKIRRYINGEADESERKYVENMLLNGENNLYLRNCIREDWEHLFSASDASKPELGHLLDKIHYSILKAENSKRQKPLQKIVRLYMKAAAILLLPALIAASLLYTFTTGSEKSSDKRETVSTIYAPLGSRVNFNLPDGTTGMLNSGSSLTYSIPFANNRKVQLEGEAWFDIKKDEKNPFEIGTGNSIVRVLGTSFNLSAYPVENYVEVVLEHGRVEFQDKQGNQAGSLLPEERLVYQNGEITKTKADPMKYSAWTRGMLVFRGDQMAEVARRIERWYNVKVILADKELERYSFRATFQDDKIEDVLALLSMTSPIKYKIRPRHLLSDGTYEKEVVTIYLKRQTVSGNN